MVNSIIVITSPWLVPQHIFTDAFALVGSAQLAVSDFLLLLFSSLLFDQNNLKRTREVERKSTKKIELEMAEAKKN